MDDNAGVAALCDWFARHVPRDWFTSPPRVLVDREEIVVLGELAVPDTAGVPEALHARACAAHIERFREVTRDHRMRIAAEAERRFGLKVSWGATCGDVERLFTSLSVPVMTRLRLPERGVLDTLVDAGVARSRSDALAWCVRLVGRNESEWIAQLRDAFAHVERVRAAGPRSGSTPGGGLC